jgi:signal transduction histidine kinase
LTPLLFAAAIAAEPPWQVVTADDGLASEHIDDLALGPDGPLWVATHAGLYTWSGQRAHRVDGGAIDHEIARVVVDRAGVAWARDALGGGWRLANGQVTPVADGDRVAVVLDLALDPTGAAHALVPGAVVRLSGDGLTRLSDAPPGARVLRPGLDGAWLIGTDTAWWRYGPGDARAALGETILAVDAEVLADGTAWTLDIRGRLRHVDVDGAARRAHDLPGRGMSLTTRGDELWASTDQVLARVRPGAEPELWGPEQGVHTGGPLLIDHEGGVWLGTFRGLLHLAEPGALLWGRRDGLPVEAGRSLFVDGARAWAATWGGLGWVELPKGPAHAFPGPVVKNPLCADASGHLWTIGSDGHFGAPRFVRIAPDGTWKDWPAPTSTNFWDACATTPDGRVWLTADPGLYLTPTDVGPPTLEAPWPTAMSGVRSLVQHRDGTLWASAGRTACARRDGPAWRCVASPSRAGISDLVQTESGGLWASDIDLGVSRLVGDTFVPIPGAAALASRHILGLAPSRAGGTWVLGHGVVSRVHDRPDHPDGWELVEELAPQLGHLVSGATDLIELDNGAVWIAHNGGLTSLDPSFRRRADAAPGVLIEELRVDGQVQFSRDLTLPTPDSHVALRYVAASWRAPSLLRYRVRVDDGAWGASTEPGWLELRALGPGAHHVEIAASTDGRTWTDPPARVALTVPRPWYGRPEPWAAVLIAALIAAALVDRARSAVALRIAALRTRIALDLHDHIGSGLGAIRLLAGVLRQPDLPPDARAEAADRVARAAQELGGAVRGIVWSLRPASLFTDELGRYLVERARDLLPGVALTADVDERRDAVDLDVLRAVQLIGLEALHNAARHSEARAVRVTLRPDGDRWRLEIADDGVGFDAPAPRADGLPGMRERAHEVGAALTIDGRRGTTVTLRFRATAPRWRLRSP